MLRWLFCLVALLVMTVIAFFITPFLPLFAQPRMGPIDNNHGMAVEPRLPTWLAWFDTPDNSLLGDNNWKATHNGDYWSMVQWLYRNSLYGFKWGPIAAPNDGPRTIHGDPTINCNNGHYGTMSIEKKPYWQWKYVEPIGSTGWCWMLNFGWLLNDLDPPKALFMFSPRVVRIHIQPTDQC